MKRTEKKRKLGLMAELVRTLATADLIAVHGGAIRPGTSATRPPRPVSVDQTWRTSRGRTASEATIPSAVSFAGV